MKKLSYLIVFTVLSFATTTIFAQEVADPTELAETTVQEKVEIQLSELPEPVTEAIAKDYQGYTATKAFKSSHDGQDIYTVQLAKDDETFEVSYTAEGKKVE